MLKGDFRNKLDLNQTLKKRENYPPLDNVDGKFYVITDGKDEPAVVKTVQNELNQYKDRELRPGEEPDTKSALGIDFEETGIPPAKWKNICPYNTEKYPLTQIGISRLFADWAQGKAWYDPVTKEWYVRWNKQLVLDTDFRRLWIMQDQEFKTLNSKKTFKKNMGSDLNQMRSGIRFSLVRSHIVPLIPQQKTQTVISLRRRERLSG